MSIESDLMPYLTCLHCQRPFAQPSKRRYCSILCKSAIAKQSAKLRLADDRHHETTRRQPTFDLTDLECLKIEARLDAQEGHVFDGKGFAVKAAHLETGPANVNELHEPWASKGADLDVWEIRRMDRGRFGGFVLTSELARVMARVLSEIRAVECARVPLDGLDSQGFHLKLWPSELDRLTRSHLETSGQAYDRDLLNAA